MQPSMGNNSLGRGLADSETEGMGVAGRVLQCVGPSGQNHHCQWHLNPIRSTNRSGGRAPDGGLVKR